VSDFLAAMAASSRERARQARDADLRARLGSIPPPRSLDVSGPGFDLIAEPKPTSPAEGTLIEGSDPLAAVVGLAEGFAAAGAAAISVLTEITRFGGTLRHLEAVAAVVEAPVMRKDFLVDPVQVVEARATGASGVLLLARLCQGSLLEEMVDLALALGMFVLVEVFDRADLEEASTVFDRDVLVGVNSRDLVTLAVDRTRFAALAPLLPGHLPWVAESGITRPEHAVDAARLGYRMVLAGTGLVTSAEPAEVARAFLAAGRAGLEEVLG
jgi:indole-3-glycerol phosphate synthase